MKEFLLSIIVIVGNAFLYLWRRYGIRDARKEKLLEELEKIRIEMDDSLHNRDYVKYHHLVYKWMRLNNKIARLER